MFKVLAVKNNRNRPSHYKISPYFIVKVLIYILDLILNLLNQRQLTEQNQIQNDTYSLMERGESIIEEQPQYPAELMPYIEKIQNEPEVMATSHKDAIYFCKAMAELKPELKNIINLILKEKPPRTRADQTNNATGEQTNSQEHEKLEDKYAIKFYYMPRDFKELKIKNPKAAYEQGFCDDFNILFSNLVKNDVVNFLKHFYLIDYHSDIEKPTVVKILDRLYENEKKSQIQKALLDFYSDEYQNKRNHIHQSWGQALLVKCWQLENEFPKTTKINHSLSKSVGNIVSKAGLKSINKPTNNNSKSWPFLNNQR
tara:strand:- start:14911 stop:15849 length:939 start_codon:yes stop_codon:yes gene_type:complete